MVVVEFFPWGGAGGDDGQSASKGFGDDESEVFAVGRENEKVALQEEVDFGFAPGFAEEMDIVEVKPAGEFFDFGEVAGFIGTDDAQLPMSGADGGPGMEEIEQTLFRVNAGKEQGLAAGWPAGLIWRGQFVGGVDAVWDEGDRVGEPGAAEAEGFGSGGGAEACRAAQAGAGVEPKCAAFFPGGLAQSPRLEHAMGRNDVRAAVFLRPAPDGEGWVFPEAVQMNQGGPGGPEDTWQTGGETESRRPKDPLGLEVQGCPAVSIVTGAVVIEADDSDVGRGCGLDAMGEVADAFEQAAGEP